MNDSTQNSRTLWGISMTVIRGLETLSAPPPSNPRQTYNKPTCSSLFPSPTALSCRSCNSRRCSRSSKKLLRCVFGRSFAMSTAEGGSGCRFPSTSPACRHSGQVYSVSSDSLRRPLKSAQIWWFHLLHRSHWTHWKKETESV